MSTHHQALKYIFINYVQSPGTSPFRYSVPARTAKRTSLDLDEMIRKNGGRQVNIFIYSQSIPNGCRNPSKVAINKKL